MKPAANTSASVPEQTIQPNNQKTGAFIGKIRHVATALVAGLGLVSSAEAVEVQKHGLPNSTVSGPTLAQGTDTTVVQYPLATDYNSRIYSPTAVASDTASDIITLHLSAADVGNGGTLTITGRMNASAGSSIGSSTGSGFSGVDFRVQQQAQFGLVGGAMTTMASFDSGYKHNISSPSINGLETWFHDDTFTYSMNITQAGDYELKNILMRENATGNAQFQNFTLSYTPNTKLINIDTNKNSIPDKWEIDKFGMLTPADADPDGDGMNNLLEYAFDTNPNQSNSSPLIPGFETIQGQKYFTVSFPKNPTATHLNYTIESCTNLQNWNTLSVTQDTQTKVIDTVPVTNNTKRFLRLKVDPKP